MKKIVSLMLLLDILVFALIFGAGYFIGQYVETHRSLRGQAIGGIGGWDAANQTWE